LQRHHQHATSTRLTTGKPGARWPSPDQPVVAPGPRVCSALHPPALRPHRLSRAARLTRPCPRCVLAKYGPCSPSGEDVIRRLSEFARRIACVRRRCFPRKGRAQRRQGATRRTVPRFRRMQESWGQCASRLVLARSGRSRSSQSPRQHASQREASTAFSCATPPRSPLSRAPPHHAPPHSAPFFPEPHSLPRPGSPRQRRARDGRRAGGGYRPARTQIFSICIWRTSRNARPRLDTPLGSCFSARSSRTLGARTRRRRDRRAGGRVSRCVRAFSVSHLFFACRETERAQALHRDEESVVLASLAVPSCTTAGILATLPVCRCAALLRFSPHHPSSLPNSRTPTRVNATCSIARSIFG
jgi:hypothetical protein